ncbi:terpene synthase family protein [Aquimarina gracilis]|uniref:Terpene synthase family protein n=1 Tax=Aquimarina gracilis TaxID=874422 RepID=A0ABU5ZV20_9FLAO|nr:terpene synthase family protein [Aquimarina gracilis]MEB3345844.1 terpene synthase family protein [Aquimarina gracilis]
MPYSEPKPQTWFIKSSINPNFQYARQHCLDRALKFKFVKKNDRNYQRLEISKIWMLTARAYPCATKEELCFATQWFTWLFCHDDICGVAKELKEGTINLITCLQHEYNISIEEAIKKAQKMCDIEMEDFFEFKKRLPKFEEQKSLQQYTAGLEPLVQGHIDWYSDTERYIVKD